MSFNLLPFPPPQGLLFWFAKSTWTFEWKHSRLLFPFFLQVLSESHDGVGQYIRRSYFSKWSISWFPNCSLTLARKQEPSNWVEIRSNTAPVMFVLPMPLIPQHPREWHLMNKCIIMILYSQWLNSLKLELEHSLIRANNINQFYAWTDEVKGKNSPI